MVTLLEKGLPTGPQLNIYLESAKKRMSFVRSRAFQRIATISLLCSLTLTFIIVSLFHVNNGRMVHKILGTHPSAMPSCMSRNITGDQDLWKECQDRHQDKMDDKFTIAMQTYKRPKELNKTLNALLGEEIPSLHEIVVVWNDIEDEPPADFNSTFGIPVRYRLSMHNSLNEKFSVDPDYETQAILLSDDDVHYKPKDLEFAFQTWRKFGRNRLTGALARCSDPDEDGMFTYTPCSNDAGLNHYSMILSNLAFAHLSFLDYYSSNQSEMNRIREYVDDKFNCEDIALNYVQSLLTGEGPLLVSGKDEFVNYKPSNGISTKSGHVEARTKCLNDFAALFDCMPLIDETGHMKTGVVVIP